MCIWELRKALGDKAERPQFIETIPRRGYRFIGQVRAAEPEPGSVRLVGREAELGQLRQYLERALGEERQVVFVTGEPGIGKTTVVEAFLERIGVEDGLWVARGQCVEHYGAGEAYLPVLEALDRLCRTTGGEYLIGLLRRYAPMWLVQLPSLIDPAELEALQRQLAGATRERMLREIAQALETLTAERPLVLWLEDLHWSDYSTLALVSYLAQRRERARLLVIGTYRPVEVLAREHPLKSIKQELQIHGYCQELVLGLLGEAAVGEYLTLRFSGSQLPAELARIVHQRTEGNPLFLVNVTDYLVAQKVVIPRDEEWELRGDIEEVAGAVPVSLRQFIEQQVDRVSPEERQVLEAASVAGLEFSAAAVAAGVERTVEEIEKRCQELVRREQLLRANGMEEWPDGTVAACYSFVHALYQNVLYEQVTAGRRMRLHQRIGEREEGGYGEKVEEIVAELAVHFEQGRDYRRAVKYLQQAGEKALRRHAYEEAIGHLTKELELLKTLPDSPERAQQELLLQTSLGSALIATKGQATLEVEKTYTRAWELCRQVGEPPQLFSVLTGLRQFYLGRGKLQTAHELGEQLLSLAQSVQDPALLIEAHYSLGNALFWLGKLVSAQAHFEQGTALYNPQKHRSLALLYGVDPGVGCLSFLASALWYLGYPDRALERSHEALTLAQELAHPFSLAFALSFAALLHHYRRESQAVRERAEAIITLCTEQGFAFWLVGGIILRGWALAEQGQGEEGITQMRQSMAALRAMGAELGQQVFLTLLAKAYGKGGQAKEGLTVLAEALAAMHKSGERYYEAELYRLKGELLLAQVLPAQEGKRQKRFPRCGVPTGTKGKSEKISEAEECFWKAIEVARRHADLCHRGVP